MFLKFVNFESFYFIQSKRNLKRLQLIPMDARGPDLAGG